MTCEEEDEEGSASATPPATPGRGRGKPTALRSPGRRDALPAVSMLARHGARGGHPVQRVAKARAPPLAIAAAATSPRTSTSRNYRSFSLPQAPAVIDDEDFDEDEEYEDVVRGSSPILRRLVKQDSGNKDSGIVSEGQSGSGGGERLGRASTYSVSTPPPPLDAGSPSPEGRRGGGGDGSGGGAVGHPGAYQVQLVSELRQLLTLKQHYYPEGGWGWVVVWASVAVHALSHGLHVAFGILLQETMKKFPTAGLVRTGWWPMYNFIGFCSTRT
ncbi:hypothetical protein J437_LFUL008503 [Ladona fulva]|uniref:Uncharacterized protein n=1 Tax=Ladona fulva TaxID=123851 RepID=A0A8K0K2E8_LADFU|nr:hypothetical protein J437_LFUL008503 [Ladona fulva]